MDFKDAIKQISDRSEKLKENLLTEEATKNALIMPFLQALGYDVFNPLEVVPEFTCDIGTKKGEKIDYAIFKDNEPVMLVECKHWQQDLNLHDNQLLRYFNVSKAKFGLLTNGIVYRFYTDLETPNKMDEKPFLEVDLSDLKNNHIEELKKFHKTYFNVENILSSANDLKYTSALKSVASNEFTNPSPEFVKLLSKQVYNGIITPKLLEQFAILVKKSIAGLINDTISDRLKTALKTETQENEGAATEEVVENTTKESNIVTTDEEMEAYFIVKSIVRTAIDAERVTYRDVESYFSILIDNNRLKSVCRLYFNSSKNKQIAFTDDSKKETKYKIETLDDIYKYTDDLVKSAVKYL
jgi:hypothetical protein